MEVVEEECVNATIHRMFPRKEEEERIMEDAKRLRKREEQRERKRIVNRARVGIRMQEAARRAARIQEEHQMMGENRVGDDWVWCVFQGWREGRNESRRGITRPAFNMVDFMLVAKDIQKRLSLSESIFHYPETRIVVFYENKKRGKKCMMRLEGYEGASWFDYRIQLIRFLPKNAKIIEITIFHKDSKIVVVFIPRVFVQKISKKYNCPVLDVDTKTGDSTRSTSSLIPSTYNPRMVKPEDDEYLF